MGTHQLKELEEQSIQRISAKSGGLWLQWRELWQSRELLYSLALRDFKVRFVKTQLGWLWAIFQPLLSVLLLYVVFDRVLGIQPDGQTPYLPFAFSGIVLWNAFNNLTSQTASALIQAQPMIRKIYFPRLSLPLSKLLVVAFDLAIGFALFVVLLLAYGLPVQQLWIFIPTSLASLSLGLGLGLLVSTLSIQFRDLQQALPTILQLLFFISPVAYPNSLLTKIAGGESAWWLYLNPMTGILEIQRAFLFQAPLQLECLLSILLCLILLLLGLWSFLRTQNKLADHL